eukprot:TRINITY_DN413_c0_g1_i7.p1 TRINITY_DN413_c0_g1~~TRINITY_DN413_c0_g1_i7.p1  ORF type:complete len:404 (+),score=146.25 TRINITY_DN413_c0_g1_i7:548-1759(+)
MPTSGPASTMPSPPASGAPIRTSAPSSRVPSPTTAHNCEWSEKTEAPWTAAQKKYCCEKEGVRCPEKKSSEEEAELKKCLMELEKKGESSTNCCKVHGVGCPSEKYVCVAGETMSKAKREWCCKEKDIGCRVDCEAESLSETEDKEFCCQEKGTWCGVETQQEQAVPTGSLSFRLKMKGDAASLLANPKQFLRRFRVSMLAASPALRKKPEDLVVTRIGSLMAGNAVPKLGRWFVDVPLQWNSEPLQEGMSFNGRNGKALGAAAVSSSSQVGDDGVFTEYYFKKGSEGKEEVEAAVAQALENKGPLADNQRGYGMVVEPVEGGTEELKKDDDNDSAWSPLAYAAAAAGGLLCVGGVAALSVFHKKRQASNDEASLTQLCQAMEVELEQEDASEYKVDRELGSI